METQLKYSRNSKRTYIVLNDLEVYALARELSRIGWTVYSKLDMNFHCFSKYFNRISTAFLSYFNVFLSHFHRISLHLNVFLCISVISIVFLFISHDASAATFRMQTGYYVGNDRGTVSVTGVGFRPNLVVIKDVEGSVEGVWKSSAMNATSTAFFTATSDLSNTAVTLDADGFTVDARQNDSVVAGNDMVNTKNTLFFWIAFAGSDCTSAGTFCVGSYQGTGVKQAITSVGFQPDLVWVKKAINGTARSANWRSSAMPLDISLEFDNIAQNNTAIVSLDATGFSVDTDTKANENSFAYWYVAFKEVAGSLDVGGYTGNSTARIIDSTASSTSAGMTFSPSWVFIKATSSSLGGTVGNAVFNTLESHGDNSLFFDTTGDATGQITGFLPQGFGLGTNNRVNISGADFYYAAFCCAPDYQRASGAFKMKTGSYGGNNTQRSITGLGFAPDLVIIKNNSASTSNSGAVFSTSLMATSTAIDFFTGDAFHTRAIISLDTGGFTVGTDKSVNDAADTYFWAAFGNAWHPYKQSGAADFMIGAYNGNFADDRFIDTRTDTVLGLVTACELSTVSACRWRSSAHVGDSSSFFLGSADAVNHIQTLRRRGFELGASNAINDEGFDNFWFGFVNGPYVTSGQYGGNGADNRSIPLAGFYPDMLWAKRNGATSGQFRLGAQVGDTSLSFSNVAQFANAIQNFISKGFEIGTDNSVNLSTAPVYTFVAWKEQRTSVKLRGTIRLRNVKLF